MSSVMEQLLQFAGAGMVLAAFISVRTGKLAHDSFRSLYLNFVGSAILALLATIESQWGFLLLEGCWALVSLQGICSKYRPAR